MSAFGRTRAWLRAIAMRGRMEREMHEEMAAHVAQATERFMARGMSERDALFAARREFGQLGAVQEDAREARGGRWLDSLAGDLKYAFRYFARTPLTTITIVLTLALGIGFSSATFSVINGILTRPAPGVPDDPALVKIRGISNAPPFARRLSYPELSAYAGLTDKFASVAGWVTSAVVVDLGDKDLGVIRARAHFVTPNYFGTLGIRLAAGRGFDQSRFDERFPPELTAIVSQAFASEHFGEARGAVGKQLKVNGVVVTIVGVAPPRFNGPIQSGEPRTLWLPLSSWQPVAKVSDEMFASPTTERFEALARLQPNVALAKALPAVRVVAARAHAEARARTKRTSTATADVVHLRGLMEVTGRYDDELGPVVAAFTAAALLILLVCTTTVNSLLVGAAVARRYEIGVRLALGASRRRVVRQLLTEISILALAGGALGMWGFGALSRLVEVAKDGFDVSPDWTTTGFTVSYAVLTAMLCGLSPALHATHAGLSDVLKDRPGGTSRLQRTFVVAQIAIAQPLMVALAAVITSVAGGIEPTRNATLRERLLMAEFDTHVGFTLKEPDRIPNLVQRLADLPGVAAVLEVGLGQGGISLELPPSDSLGHTWTPPGPSSAAVFDVPPGYFRTVEAPIVRGREFVASDTTLAVTPLVIAESLAVALFKSSDPIGRRLLRVSRYDGRPANERPAELEVVGVVRMERETNTLEYESDLPPVFVPFRQRREGYCFLTSCITGAKLLIRTTGPAEALMPTVMAVAREEARMVPLTRIRTLAQGDRLRRSSRLEATAVVVGCGVVALILASIGLYAMVSVAVGQRRREIGIRLALGAQARQVVRMFFRSGLRVTLVGLALGLPLSVVGLLVILRQTEDLPRDTVPAVAALVTLAVVGVASLASWLPARRASGVDPMVALRSE